jgi:hypothetical protein
MLRRTICFLLALWLPFLLLTDSRAKKQWQQIYRKIKRFKKLFRFKTITICFRIIMLNGIRFLPQFFFIARELMFERRHEHMLRTFPSSLFINFPPNLRSFKFFRDHFQYNMREKRHLNWNICLIKYCKIKRKETAQKNCVSFLDNERYDFEFRGSSLEMLQNAVLCVTSASNFSRFVK